MFIEFDEIGCSKPASSIHPAETGLDFLEVISTKKGGLLLVGRLVLSSFELVFFCGGRSSSITYARVYVQNIQPSLSLCGIRLSSSELHTFGLCYPIFASGLWEVVFRASSWCNILWNGCGFFFFGLEGCPDISSTVNHLFVASIVSCYLAHSRAFPIETTCCKLDAAVKILSNPPKTSAWLSRLLTTLRMDVCTTQRHTNACIKHLYEAKREREREMVLNHVEWVCSTYVLHLFIGQMPWDWREGGLKKEVIIVDTHAIINISRTWPRLLTNPGHHHHQPWYSPPPPLAPPPAPPPPPPPLRSCVLSSWSSSSSSTSTATTATTTGEVGPPSFFRTTNKSAQAHGDL